MPELDRLKEQVAYLKLWQGVMVVTDISLVGWLASAADGTRPVLVALAVITVALVTTGIVIPSTYRTPYRSNRETIAMDILVGIVMLAVAIVFVGIALDAARHK